MKMMEELREQLKSIGGSLDDNDYFFCCDAPMGYCWNANNLPTIHVDWASNSQTWLAKAIKWAHEDLAMGLYKVTDEAELKEIRWNNDDDTWGANESAPERIEWPK